MNYIADFPRFDRKIRNRVCATADGLPTLGEWLDRVRALDRESLTAAVDGIWCGREGEARIELPGGQTYLVVGWYNGKVEFCYLS